MKAWVASVKPTEEKLESTYWLRFAPGQIRGGLQLRDLHLHDRSGMSEMLSTIVAVPFLLIVIGMLLYFGRAFYAKAAVEDAAVAGARFAQTTLSGEQGCAQTQAAIDRVLQGHYLDPDGASFTVTAPPAGWGRGREAVVRVRYTVGQRFAPIVGPLLGPTSVESRYTVRIDAFNSRWANGWIQCATTRSP